MKIIECTGYDALQKLAELREAFSKTELYPFLIGNQENLERLTEWEELAKDTTQTILSKSKTIDMAVWFEERLKQELDEENFDKEELAGAWPDEKVEAQQIVSHVDILTGEELPQVYLGQVPLQYPWELPAVVKFGGWNECPNPDIHCAVMRYWNELYGAEIVSLTGDVIECKVSNPPRSQEAAMALAWEQYWYCADIVTQGVDTISNLAASLLDAEYWYFWWD